MCQIHPGIGYTSEMSSAVARSVSPRWCGRKWTFSQVGWLQGYTWSSVMSESYSSARARSTSPAPMILGSTARRAWRIESNRRWNPRTRLTIWTAIQKQVDTNLHSPVVVRAKPVFDKQLDPIYARPQQNASAWHAETARPAVRKRPGMRMTDAKPSTWNSAIRRQQINRRRRTLELQREEAIP